MKNRRKIFLWLCLGLSVVGCSPAASHGEGSLIERIEHSESGDELAIDHDISIDHLLLEIRTVPVESELEIPFHTVARSGEIVKYPCSSCHEKPLDTTLSSNLAHVDIELQHADQSILTCTSCHAAENLDSLHSLTGKPIEFDHSYQLCAQCHTQQVEDWVGGAHGKRVGGWAPPRVIESCTTCHNPHDPHLESRWPAVTGGGIQEQE